MYNLTGYMQIIMDHMMTYAIRPSIQWKKKKIVHILNCIRVR